MLAEIVRRLISENDRDVVLLNFFFLEDSRVQNPDFFFLETESPESQGEINLSVLIVVAQWLTCHVTTMRIVSKF